MLINHLHCLAITCSSLQCFPIAINTLQSLCNNYLQCLAFLWNTLQFLGKLCISLQWLAMSFNDLKFHDLQFLAMPCNSLKITLQYKQTEVLENLVETKKNLKNLKVEKKKWNVEAWASTTCSRLKKHFEVVVCLPNIHLYHKNLTFIKGKQCRVVYFLLDRKWGHMHFL